MDNETRSGLARSILALANDPAHAPESKLASLVESVANIEALVRSEAAQEPVPMVLFCPACGSRHIDRGENATRVHRTHACQSCGFLFAPAVVPTVGVQFLPGCKDKPMVLASKSGEERRDG